MQLNKECYTQLIEASKDATSEYEVACKKYESDPSIIDLRSFESLAKKFCDQFAEGYDDTYGFEYVHSFEFKGERFHWVFAREDRYKYMSVPVECLPISRDDIRKHDWAVDKEKDPIIKKVTELGKQREETQKAIKAVQNIGVEPPEPLLKLLDSQTTTIDIYKNDLARLEATKWLHTNERDM